MNKIHSHILVLIVGTATGAAITWQFTKPEKVQGDKVIVRRISGARITHDRYRISPGALHFTTTADGKGTAETTIPKSVIPEARAWMTRRHGIDGSTGYQWSPSGCSWTGSLAYRYRIGIFSFGPGVDFSKNHIRLEAGIQYWF